MKEPRLQAERFWIRRLEVDSCFRHSGGSRSPGGSEPWTENEPGCRQKFIL